MLKADPGEVLDAAAGQDRAASISVRCGMIAKAVASIRPGELHRLFRRRRTLAGMIGGKVTVGKFPALAAKWSSRSSPAVFA